MFVDEYRRPLPGGTALRVVGPADHEGIVAYTQFGEQVMLHNSKKLGRA